MLVNQLAIFAEVEVLQERQLRFTNKRSVIADAQVSRVRLDRPLIVVVVPNLNWKSTNEYHRP
jgi:hypothetical protein